MQSVSLQPENEGRGPLRPFHEESLGARQWLLEGRRHLSNARARGDAARNVRGVGRVVSAGVFNHDGEFGHRGLLRVRPV